MQDIEKFLEQKSKEIDAVIEKWVPKKYDTKSMESAFGKARYNYNIPAANKAVAEPIWDLLGRGGKRWRPALMMLICEALGGDPARFKDWVAIPELVHNGCVTADTFILKNPGEYVKITEIKPGDYVYTFDEGKLARRKVLGVWADGLRKIYRVQTANREIRASENHPLLVLEMPQPVRCKVTQAGRAKLKAALKRGDIKSLAKKLGRSERVLYNAFSTSQPQLLAKEELDTIFTSLGLKTEAEDFTYKETKYEAPEISLVWKPVSELKEGDLVVVLRKASLNGVAMNLPSPTKNPPKDSATLPKLTTPEFCQLIGYLLGDGSVTINKKGSRVYLCMSPDPKEVSAYSDLFKKVFGYTLREEKQAGRGHKLVCCSYKVCWLLEQLGLKKLAIQKTVPQWVFTLPESQELAFLRGFLDSDGYVTKEGATVLASASHELVKGLKLLVDSLGFNSSKLGERTVRNLWSNAIKKESQQFFFSISGPKKVLDLIGSEKAVYRERLAKGRSREISYSFQRLFSKPPFDAETFRLDRIEKIEFDGDEEAYDLVIEGSHNYIANNVVVHNTLMVDDVEDDSELRRGKPCTHKIYGADIAINAGNAMYYLPLQVLLKSKGKIPDSTLNKAYEIYTQEMINISLGQAMDIAWHRGIADADNLSENEYLQMCAFKTGTLARMAAKLGALLAGANEDAIEKMGEFAESVGIGFQIRDDVLNLTATSGRNQFTKDYIGEDIHEGKRTLMVIHALSAASAADKKRLLEILKTHTRDRKLIDEAIAILGKYNSIEYAKRRAQEIVQNAWKNAEKLMKEGTAKETLRTFVDFMILRQY